LIVILAGSRSLGLYELLCRAVVHSEFSVTEVVSGGARGVDALGERWSLEHLGKPATRFAAEWEKYGRRAGFIRNAQMAQHAEALVALMLGHTRGTSDMVERMRAAAKPVYLERYSPIECHAEDPQPPHDSFRY
jgi:hypothetical protein